MPVSQSYLDFVCEQLNRVAPLDARRMFSGVGLYSDETFFALIADDTLYFFTDATTAPDYDAAGAARWGRRYRALPVDVLEDIDQLRQWTALALQAARRKPRR